MQILLLIDINSDTIISGQFLQKHIFQRRLLAVALYFFASIIRASINVGFCDLKKCESINSNSDLLLEVNHKHLYLD